MSLMIKDILNKNLFIGTRLVAGKSGNTNVVTWVNVMEILDTPDSVKKGELLVTTGFDLDDAEKHKHLIRRLKERGVSGLAIQTGYYIKTIPDYIMKEANYYDFPILDLPSHYSFSEILHVMMNEINQRKDYLSEHFTDTNLLINRIQKKLASDNNTIDWSGHYVFCIVSISEKSTDLVKVSACMEQIHSYLSSRAKSCIYETIDNGQTVFCLNLSSIQELSAIIYDFQIQLTFLSEREGIHFYAGVESIKSFTQLSTAFDHALKCIVLLHDISAIRGVCIYDNFTFIKMFGLLYKNNRSFVLDNQYLQTLLNHDRVNGTNYVHTIRTYLAENCNVTRTAQRLFIHRHTLMNRIQIITELCHINFNDYYTRIYMSMALLIHDYFAV